MLKKKFISIVFFVIGIVSILSSQAFAQGSANNKATASSDSSLVYPFEDEGEFQYPDEIAKDPLYLNRPSNIQRSIVYDPVSKQYVIYEKIGNMYYR